MSEDGRVVVDVDPSMATGFYCSPAYAGARERVREAIPLRQRLQVLVLWGSSHILIVISFVAAWNAFRWWSVPVIGATSLWWLNYLVNSSTSRLALLPCVLGLPAWIVIAVWLQWRNDVVNWGVLLIAAALLGRLSHLVAASLFKALVLRNWRAFSLFRETAIFVKDPTGKRVFSGARQSEGTSGTNQDSGNATEEGTL